MLSLTAQEKKLKFKNERGKYLFDDHRRIFMFLALDVAIRLCLCIV